MQYIWKNLESGNSGTLEFSPKHDPVFGTHKDTHPKAIRAAKELIYDWNQQQPKTWSYELVEPK